MLSLALGSRLSSAVLILLSPKPSAGAVGKLSPVLFGVTTPFRCAGCSCQLHVSNQWLNGQPCPASQPTRNLDDVLGSYCTFRTASHATSIPEQRPDMSGPLFNTKLTRA